RVAMECVEAESRADGLQEIAHNRGWKHSIHGGSPKDGPAQDLRGPRDGFPLLMDEESAIHLDAMPGTMSVEQFPASARESRRASECVAVAELAREEWRISTIASGHEWGLVRERVERKIGVL